MTSYMKNLTLVALDKEERREREIEEIWGVTADPIYTHYH